MPNLFIHNNPKYIVTNDKTNTETIILSQVNTQPTQPSSSDIVPIFSLIFPIFVIGIFATVFGLLGFAIYKGISTAAYNRKQPIISREAKVVSKRQHVSGGGGNGSTSTSYYITFEFTDSSREELGLSGREYALIAEGDKGTLYSQGTWFKEFKRQF
ncbi:MAG: DUF2500 domain-containing protein [Calothrix sp. FI2-JRJ7]|jgi:hypothetical protein|nr:DUF2500 domain-containing protein [Calothrix sp. FI2-JRJ7]